MILRHQLAVALRGQPRAYVRLTWPDQAWLALLAAALRRRLLIGLIQACTPDLDGVWSWSAGADDASTRPGRATTGDAAMRSPQCRCSTNRQRTSAYHARAGGGPPLQSGEPLHALAGTADRAYDRP